MSSLRIVAVDDEPLALDRLKVLLAECPGAELVGSANGCTAAQAVITRHRPDLILLDIQMRDGSGFDLLEQLPEGDAPMVAFVTAFPKYACQAFGVRALDYLLKPVEQEDLDAMIRKARGHLELTSAQDRIAELKRIIEELRSDNPGASDRSHEREIWIRHRGTDHVRVPTEAIDWITAQDDYASIHAAGREHLLRISLDRLMESLDPKQFTRVHRSYVVRNERVAKVALKRVGTREVILHDGTRIPVGRVHARNLAWRSHPDQFAGSGKL